MTMRLWQMEKRCGEGAQGANRPNAGAGAWAALILGSQGIAKPLFGGGRVDKVVKSIAGSDRVSRSCAERGREYFTKQGWELCSLLVSRRFAAAGKSFDNSNGRKSRWHWRLWADPRGE